MKLCYHIALLPVAGAALLSSCAVYVPTVPSTPLVTEAGQVELSAGIRGLTSLEARGAWSPAKHVVATIETALLTNDGSETSNNTTFKYTNLHKQVSVGMGTYHLVGPKQQGYLGAIGGFGLAKASIYDPHLDFLILPIFGRPPITYYEATYQRYYGQFYAAHLGRVVSYGGSLRGTFVHYSLLRRDDVDITSPTNFFIEPTFFVRIGSGPWQFQGTAGFSTPASIDSHDENRSNLSPVSLLISGSVVFRPHWLRARDLK